MCVERACTLLGDTAVQSGRGLPDGGALPLPVSAQRLVTAHAGTQGAVGAGGVGGVVVESSTAACRLGAVLVPAVSAQQLTWAEVTRHRHSHRRRAALQAVPMAMTGATAQEGLGPLPVTGCGDDEESVNREL